MGGTLRMSFSVASIVAGVQRVYSMLQSADVVGYLNEARPDILRRLRLRNTTQTLNLTAGQSEYAITTPMLGATAVEYVRSGGASDVKVLEPTNVETLDITNPSWRTVAATEPRSYYFSDSVSGPVVGLFPAPHLSTSGGYPLIRIRYLDCNALSGGDTVYDNVLSPMIYVHAVCKRYAEDRGLEDLALRMKLFSDEMGLNEAYLKGRQTKAGATRLRVASRRASAAT